MKGAPVIGDVRHLLLDIEEENDRLESDLTSPNLARMTEYAIARESGDPTLRRIGPIAKRLRISIRELTADSVALPPIYKTLAFQPRSWLSAKAYFGLLTPMPVRSIRMPALFGSSGFLSCWVPSSGLLAGCLLYTSPSPRD